MATALVDSAPRPALTMIRPLISAAEMVESHKEIAALIAGALEKGVDYGVIPGTGDKPTLLKPGAERLTKAFGCATAFTVVEQDVDHDRTVTWQKKKKVWNNKFKGDKSFSMVVESGESLGLYRFVMRCDVITQNGQIVGSGIGICSTLEAKYCDRPRECENTVVKMAQKRAQVAAVLNAFGLSARFTQDAEETHGEQEDATPAPAPAPSPIPSEPMPTAADLSAFETLMEDPRWTNDERKLSLQIASKATKKKLSGMYDRAVKQLQERSNKASMAGTAPSSNEQFLDDVNQDIAAAAGAREPGED